MHSADSVLVGARPDGLGGLVADWMDVNFVASHADVIAASPSDLTVRLTNSDGTIKGDVVLLEAAPEMKDLDDGQIVSGFGDVGTGDRFYFTGSLVFSGGWQPVAKVSVFEVG